MQSKRGEERGISWKTVAFPALTPRPPGQPSLNSAPHTQQMSSCQLRRRTCWTNVPNSACVSSSASECTRGLACMAGMRGAARPLDVICVKRERKSARGPVRRRCFKNRRMLDARKDPRLCWSSGVMGEGNDVTLGASERRMFLESWTKAKYSERNTKYSSCEYFWPQRQGAKRRKNRWWCEISCPTKSWATSNKVGDSKWVRVTGGWES